jgi:hypothetical protein
MQEQTDKKNRSESHVKRKHVGDETPNPLPDGDYSSKQRPGDDGEADPYVDSSLE